MYYFRRDENMNMQFYSIIGKKIRLEVTIKKIMFMFSLTFIMNCTLVVNL